MCGIVGFVGGFVPGLMDRMNSAQAHRGPDGSGTFEDAPAEASLGHVRLAILDLSDQAAQPMISDDGRYILVFNGEIYNFRELRETLSSVGHQFRSTGDTEVLLRGLQHFGESLLARLNGMFAFALWDRRERKLLLARDQLGVKPLYYAEPEPGTLLFASEIKALCAHPGLRREPNFVALQQHLAFCHSVGEQTALAGVKRLPPGALLRWNAASPSHHVMPYWQLPFEAEPLSDRQQAVQQLQGLLRQATERQLVCDVPIGTFLSGGLDSSLITALCAKVAGQRLDCYTVTYPSSDNILDQAAEDAPYARELAARLGLKFHEITLRPDVADLWPQLISHLDEPIADPAAIACYLVCQLARQSGTTVLLSGQGADELLAGYPRYRAMQLMGWIDRMPGWLRKTTTAASHLLPGACPGRIGAGMRRIRRVLTASDRDPDHRFLDYCASTPSAAISRVFSSAVQEVISGVAAGDECLRAMRASDRTGLNRLLERDLLTYLPNHNLLYTDKMGMAVGVEARVPLLDVDLVGQACRYPAEWKLARGRTKAILRDAARPYLPARIIDRPKAGFGAPYRQWLRNDLAEMWHDLTSQSAVRERGWFDYEGIQEARRRSQSGRQDLYMLQWAVLTVELWARQFIDRNPSVRSTSVEGSHASSRSEHPDRQALHRQCA